VCHLIRYAQDAGWTCLPPDEGLRLRPGTTNSVLWPVLVAQLQRLNPGVVDASRAEDVAGAFCQSLPSSEGNLAAWDAKDVKSSH
jgi:type I restriction enzyme R subunit